MKKILLPALVLAVSMLAFVGAASADTNPDDFTPGPFEGWKCAAPNAYVCAGGTWLTGGGLFPDEPTCKASLFCRPTTYITAPATIQKGEAATISWNATKGATGCFGTVDGGGAYALPASGSDTLTWNTEGLHNVSIYCENPNGLGPVATKVINVIKPLSADCSLTADPNFGTLSRGDLGSPGRGTIDGTLSWTTSNNPSSCSISASCSGPYGTGVCGASPGSVNPAGGSAAYSLSLTTDYTMTCVNSLGTGTCSASVAVSAALPMIDVVAIPASGSAGVSGKIDYYVSSRDPRLKGADYTCTRFSSPYVVGWASGQNASLAGSGVTAAGSGSFPALGSDTTFGIACRDPLGNFAGSGQVKVTVTPPSGNTHYACAANNVCALVAGSGPDSCEPTHACGTGNVVLEPQFSSVSKGGNLVYSVTYTNTSPSITKNIGEGADINSNDVSVIDKVSEDPGTATFRGKNEGTALMSGDYQGLIATTPVTVKPTPPITFSVTPLNVGVVNGAPVEYPMTITTNDVSFAGQTAYLMRQQSEYDNYPQVSRNIPFPPTSPWPFRTMDANGNYNGTTKHSCDDDGAGNEVRGYRREDATYVYFGSSSGGASGQSNSLNVAKDCRGTISVTYKNGNQGDWAIYGMTSANSANVMTVNNVTTDDNKSYMSGGDAVVSFKATAGSPKTGGALYTIGGLGAGCTLETPASQTLNLPGSSINFTISCPGGPGGGTLYCVPPTQTIGAGQTANFSASGGAGGYDWTAAGGVPAAGSGATFSTSYSSAGSKTVRVADGAGNTASCAVNVVEGGALAIEPREVTIELGENATFCAKVGANEVFADWSFVPATPPFAGIPSSLKNKKCITLSGASGDGTVNIKAVKSDDPANSDSTNLYIVSKKCTNYSLSLEPVSKWAPDIVAIELPNGSASFRAKYLCDGSVQDDVTLGANWLSNETSVATVSKGLVRAGTSAGRAKITAEYQGESDYAYVDVTNEYHFACSNGLGGAPVSCMKRTGPLAPGESSCGSVLDCVGHYYCDETNSCAYTSSGYPYQSDCSACGGGNLSAALNASPSFGPTPLNSVLTAITMGGSGTINYTFWKNCDSASKVVSEAVAACGNWDAKFDGEASTGKATAFTFSTSSVAKVIIERGSSSAEARRAISTSGFPSQWSCVAGSCVNVPGAGCGACGGGPYYCQADKTCTVSDNGTVPFGSAGDCNAVCGGLVTHKACISNTCTLVGGSGSDECSTIGSACGAPPQTHKECVSNSCASVSGAGPDRCESSASCGSGGGDFHSVCDPNTKSCVNVSGAGESVCANDSACAGTGQSHMECQSNACVIVGGPGADQCSSIGQGCIAPTACTMTASPRIVPKGGSTTIYWNCDAGVTGCVLYDATSGGMISLGGVPSSCPPASSCTRKVVPSKSGKYVLECLKDGIKVSTEVGVTVTSLIECNPNDPTCK
jgi:hypothetical protein